MSTVAEVSERIRIEVPRSEVFAYMDQPSNQPEISPSLVRSELIESLPNGGKRVAYTYEMAGIGLDGEIHAVEYDPERRIRWEMTGDLAGTITWTFGAEDGSTVVTYASAYEVPIPVLDAVVAPFVERYNERELRTTLENLKTRLEHGSPS
jgi:uncharacterized membrane protein